MALSQEEKKIVEFGKTQGKTPEQVAQAVAKYRLSAQAKSVEAPAQEKSGIGGYLSDVWSNVKKNLTEAVTSVPKNINKLEEQKASGQPMGATSLRVATEPVANVVEAGFAPLTTFIEGAYGGAVPEVVSYAVSEASKVPEVKNFFTKMSEFSTKHPEEVGLTKDLTEIVSALIGGKVAKKPLEEGLKIAEDATVKGIKTADDLIKQGVEMGKNVKPIEKVSDTITPIEKGIETVLSKPTSLPKLEKYAKQAEIAVSDYSQKTPLEIAGEEAQKALSLIQKQMKAVGDGKKEITKGLASKKVGNITKEVVGDLQNSLIERLGIKSTEKGFSTVKGRLSKVADKADLRLIKDVENKLLQAKTFQQLDDAIDFAQGLLFKRSGLTAVPVNTQVQGILKGTIKKANDMLKELGGDAYKQANIKLSNRIQVYNKLNKALGLEGNKGASLMKQLFSPSGTAPRKLFEAVKDLTGIDLVDEATLAKFVMENIGDARQASLLEEVIRVGRPTATGLIGKAAEKVIGKLQNPMGKARRISEKAQGL